MIRIEQCKTGSKTAAVPGNNRFSLVGAVRCKTCCKTRTVLGDSGPAMVRIVCCNIGLVLGNYAPSMARIVWCKTGGKLGVVPGNNRPARLSGAIVPEQQEETGGDGGEDGGNPFLRSRNPKPDGWE